MNTPYKIPLMRRIWNRIKRFFVRAKKITNVSRHKRKKVRIYSIERITAGKRHAWVNSNVGRIKKPLGSIPDDVYQRFIKNQNS